MATENLMRPDPPELLAPAGDMETLYFALLYGADAVYAAQHEFGLRKTAKNFSFDELSEAVRTVHGHGKKLYLACNTLPRDDEIKKLPAFLESAADCGVDALIIADIGVLEMAKKYAPKTDVHISTQAGIVNSETARFFAQAGAKRIILARELTLEEIQAIRESLPREVEIECFAHGSMCVSFSGRCLLSNYLTRRDANRGDCSQPCRWPYFLCEEKRPGEYFEICEEPEGTFILNSKDLCMIQHIGRMADAGISALKIEGRAKTFYYCAVVTNAYRAAIDAWSDGEEKPPAWAVDELFKISRREYCTGFYFGGPPLDAAVSFEGGYRRDWEVSAVVQAAKGGRLYLTQRNRFFNGETLELLQPGKPAQTIRAAGMKDGNGLDIESCPHPMMCLSIRCDLPAPQGALLRKRTVACAAGVDI
ncbi:MAG TPA: U32 family peptidase [Clostridiales bacterium]|nr:U32 family peptidase [Clostridiales bacterium]HQK73162.1 U32 family peptidase [Clostridiales bacterium]